jgi:hypothetical protein
MKPTAVTLSLTLLAALAGCASSSQYNAGVSGPTGLASDSGKITAVQVNDTWKQDLKPLSLDIVKKKLAFPDTARFDLNVQYDGFYDVTNDATRVGVWGNVTCSSDYGTTYKNGYYVTWQLPGKVKTDFPPPWHLADVEVFDQQY